MNKFYDLRIFHPMVMGGEYEKVREAIQNMICNILLEKLNQTEKDILGIKNYFIWDPNYPEQGKEQSLLEHLVFDAISHAGTLNCTDHFISKMFLYDLEKFSGISNPSTFMALIEEINEKWERLAEITIFSMHGNDPEITFKLLTKLDI